MGAATVMSILQSTPVSSTVLIVLYSTDGYPLTVLMVLPAMLMVFPTVLDALLQVRWKLSIVGPVQHKPVGLERTQDKNFET